MEKLIIYLIQANIILCLLYAAYFLFLRTETSFRFNRFYLLATWFLALGVPLLRIPQFWIQNQIPNAENLLIPFFISENGEAAKEQIIAEQSIGLSYTWHIWLIVAISLVALFLVILLLYRIHRLDQLSRKMQFRIDYKPHYTLIWTEGKLPVFSFFEKIFWHSQAHLSDEQNQAIFKHELAHVRQKHSWDVIVSELLLTVFWYNPLAWKLKKAITDNHEFLADNSSSAQLEDGSYHKLLLGQYARQYNLSLGNFFYKSTILNRLIMLNKQTQKPNFWKLAITIPVFTLLVIGFGCENSMISMQSQELDPHPTMQDSDIFSIVEEQAEPMGGITSFYEYISNELSKRYPEPAQKKGIEGTVYIQFVIEKDGSITDVQAVKGIGGGCDELAIEVVSNAGKWIPGKQNDSVVRTRRIVPIKFVLNENKDIDYETIQFLEANKISALTSDDEVFSVVENQAEPPVSLEKFFSALSQEIERNYPATAKDMGIEGNVYVQFIVEKDGSITNTEVVKGIGGGCDELANELVLRSPKWKPATHRGRSVRSRRIIPVTFIAG